MNVQQAYETVDFSLWGIPHLQVGDTLPGFYGVFNYDVGDHFGYRVTFDNGYTNYGPGYTYFGTDVTTKNANASGYQYDLPSDRLNISPPTPQGGPDSTYFPPNQSFQTYDFNTYAFLDQLPYEGFGGNTNFPVQIGVRISSTYNNRVEYIYESLIYYDTCANALGRFEDIQKSHYADGVGTTYELNFAPFFSTTHRLYCYEKINDTYGTCLDLSTLIGVEEALSEQFELHLYPQPANDQMRFERESNAILTEEELIIYALNGQQVMKTSRTTGQSTRTLDTSQLKPGMYLLRYQNASGAAHTSKFVVQH